MNNEDLVNHSPHTGTNHSLSADTMWGVRRVLTGRLCAVIHSLHCAKRKILLLLSMPGGKSMPEA